MLRIGSLITYLRMKTIYRLVLAKTLATVIMLRPNEKLMNLRSREPEFGG